MRENYGLYCYWDVNNNCFVASASDFEWCRGRGETRVEAVTSLQDEMQEWINTGHELGANKFDPLPGIAVQQQVMPTPAAPAPPQNAGEKPIELAEAQRQIPSPLVVDVLSVNILKEIGVQADFGVKLVDAGLITNEELKTALDTYVDVYFYDPRIHGLDPTRVDLEHTTANINLATGWIG